MRESTREAALISKVTHQATGGGFIHHDYPPVPARETDAATAACSPPADAADGSTHMLVAPGGREMPFSWVAAERAWERPGGVRMAFTAAYLGAHGWRYGEALKVAP